MSPIDYAANSIKAIRDHNGGFVKFGLTQYDMELLHVLKRFDRGMRERELMREARGNVNRHFILAALDRLLTDKCIVRTEYKRSVFFTITLEGRAVLDDLNDRLIKIVEEQYRNHK